MAVCGSNGSILSHVTAQMNQKLAQQAAFPSAFNQDAAYLVVQLERIHVELVHDQAAHAVARVQQAQQQVLCVDPVHPWRRAYSQRD